MKLNPISGCSICGGPLEAAFEFERYPLITSASTGGQTAPLLPISVGLCVSCAHVQLDNQPDEELLDRIYSDDYTSVVEKGAFARADRMQTECKDFLDFASPRPVRNMKLMEIGCFDGAFLSLFEDCELLGCEPNPIGKVAQQRGIDVRPRYFTRTEFPPHSIDLIVMRHLIEHLPDPVPILEDCAAIMAPSAMLLIETPHIEHTLENLVIGNFYHQHLHYFSRFSLEIVLRRAGFAIVAHARKDFRQFVLARVAGPLSAMTAPDGYAELLRAGLMRYQAHVVGMRNNLNAWLQEKDARIAIYGASSTATGIIHLGAIPPGRLAYLVDGDPRKVGFVAPGTAARVYAPEHLLDDPVDAIVIASDFYAQEITETLKLKFAGAARWRILCHPRFEVRELAAA
jgi:SAM-dependent methyltransferase